MLGLWSLHGHRLRHDCRCQAVRLLPMPSYRPYPR
jgi:hypothetical protein